MDDMQGVPDPSRPGVELMPQWRPYYVDLLNTLIERHENGASPWKSHWKNIPRYLLLPVMAAVSWMLFSRPELRPLAWVLTGFYAAFGIQHYCEASTSSFSWPIYERLVDWNRAYKLREQFSEVALHQSEAGVFLDDPDEARARQPDESNQYRPT